MKKIIYTLLSITLAMCIAFTSFSAVIVSAAETAWLTPSTYFVKGSNCSNTLLNSTVEKLKTLFARNNMVYSNYYIILSVVNNATVDGAYAFVKGNENLSNYNFTSVYDGATYNVYQSDSVYFISSDMESITFHQNNNYTLKIGLAYSNSLYCSCAFSNKNISSINGSNSYIFISDLANVPILPNDTPFVPSDYTLYGLDLAINDTDFYDWIIQNNKLSSLPSYITQTKLLSFIDFYSQYGGSFTNFVKNIPEWFSHMNILNQSKDNVNILKSSMDRLYQEYVNSFWVEVGKGSAENLPHHRRNIQTQTTDDDTTLITDDQNDTLIESILRDILRGVIQIGNQIGDGVTSIINKLSELNFTTTIVNNGGNNNTDTDVEGINSDISDTMADSIEDVPTLDTEVPNLLSAPAVVGSTVNIYLNVFQSMGLDKILIFAVTVSFLIIKIRGNTK